MKKFIKVNGKTFMVTPNDDGTQTMEEVEVEEESTEEETVEETKEEVEEKEEGDKEEITKAAKQILTDLGIDKLRDEIKELKDVNNVTPESPLVDFEKVMSKGVDDMTSNEKILGFFQAILQKNTPVIKALSEGNDADGGYLFPDEFRAEIIRDLADKPRMRNEVRIIPMKRDVMNAPTLKDGPQVTWTDENAVKSTTTADFGQKTLTAKKMAAILYSSDELIDDSTEFDIVKMIIELFAEAIGNEEDKVITAGNGTTQPEGYTQATIGSVPAATGNLNFDDIINLEFLLDAKYYLNAKFYAHKNNVKEMRKLKDDNGRYLWQEPLSQGQPSTFHGFPIFIDNNLSEAEIYFGDLKKAYWMGDRQKMTVKISQETETAFTRDQTAIRVVERIAGIVVLPVALKKLTGIA